MSFEFFIGRRYLRARQKPAFISLITVLSTAGVAVGVMTLIVVLAVMAGFESSLKSHILGIESHLLLLRHGGVFSDYRRIAEHVKNTEGVKTAEPFVYTQVMLRSKSGLSGAILRGIQPEATSRAIINAADVSPLQNLTPRPVENSKIVPPGIILGKALAGNLKVTKGDTVFMISSQRMGAAKAQVPAMRRFLVRGIFESGMHDYDTSLAYIHLSDAQDILRLGDAVTGIEVWVKDIYQARQIAEKVAEDLGFPYWTRDWMQMNRNLFAMLKLQKTVLFIILTLIVFVAAFNIASALIMMVTTKIRDIAILKAMGATDKSIRKIFVFKGMVIGAVGTTVGICLGFALCILLKHYQFVELPGDVYFFTTTLPVRIEALDVSLVTFAALAICFLATLYPAHQASRLAPVAGIRYG